MKNPLYLDDFDFSIPEALIAQKPAAKRDDARLLVRSAGGELRHHTFSNLPSLIGKNTLVILNNSSVIQSRLYAFTSTGAKVEIFLLEPLSKSNWRALAKPLKKIKTQSSLVFPAVHANDKDVHAKVIDISQNDPEELPIIEVQFDFANQPPNFKFLDWMMFTGQTPLPPYIRRSKNSNNAETDRSRYQTVFAKEPGSVAAPTAGLHFTGEILNKLSDNGAQISFVTLHVGGGTFLPVKKNDPRQHKIHTEKYYISDRTVELIRSTRANGGKVLCVGTTAFRAVESLWQLAKTENLPPDKLANNWHSTQLFICPATDEDRYKPHVTDLLLTNFHQPKSTLIMLVSGLIGINEVKNMYRVAIEQEYRFYSYGDATLLELTTP